MSKTTIKKASAKWADFSPVAQTDNSEITILTVDDNEALRYSLARSLRDAGYQVVEASNGEQALKLAAESPDLITLDVNLPDMMGFQVCRMIKSNPATAHIPVLHISATFVDPESRVRGLEQGADAYLAEPIDRAELVATVGALLRLKNAEMQARQQASAAENARKELAQLNATLEDRVNERTRELKAANESLRELSARLLQMQDDERRRIARELHDSVGQLLAAIVMNNASIATELDKLTPISANALSQNTVMTEEVLRSIRTISHLLHPPLLDEVGLPSALRWYVDEFSGRSGIKVTLMCPDSIKRLPRDLETAIFRIVQEALGNVHRHSESKTASVELDIEDKRVRLRIKDSGIGIPLARQEELKLNQRAGVGLRGMRERIAQFGGDLDIRSNNHGTIVTVVAPYEPAGRMKRDQIA